MADQTTAIAALERVLLTVEAELTALHRGEPVDRAELEQRLRTDITSPVPTPPPAVIAAPPLLPPPPPVVANKPPPPFVSQRTTTPLAAPAMAPPPPKPPPPAAPQTSAPTPSPSFGLEQVFRIGGISLLVLAAVFFVSTAISRGLLGPTAQLVSAAVASLLVIAQSFRFSEDRRPWRITFAIGGSAALFASGVVGHFGLELLGINATLAWLGTTVIGFLALGTSHNSQTVAAAGAPAAVLGTALFAATGNAPAPIVLAIGTTFGLAVLSTTWERRWHIARAFGGIATGFIILLGAVIDPVSPLIDIGVLLGVGAVVALAVSQLREYGADEEPISFFAQIEARITAVVTPWATLAASILIAEDVDLLRTTDSVGWFAIGVGLAVAIAVTALSSRMHPTMAMLHQLAALSTATVGFVTVLDGPVLLAALLGQAVISGALAYRTRSVEMVVASSLFGSVTALWTTGLVLVALNGQDMSLGEVIVTGLVLASFAGATYLVRNKLGLGGAWIFAWASYMVWVAAALQGVPQTQAAISLAWVASAVLLLVIPKMTTPALSADRFRSILNVSMGTMLLVGVKLVFVDLVAVDVLWRAGLFLLIGATFLRLAFVLPELLANGGQQPETPEMAQETGDSASSEHSSV